MIGCGAIAQVVHLPILSQIEGVRISAICDVDLPKAETIAERLGIPSVEASADSLLGLEDIDAVVICTPNHLHAEHAEAALRAGKHVLCERPLGLGRDEVNRLLETSRQTDRRLLVAHNHRYRPDATSLRDFVARGETGDLFHVRASWHRRRGRRPRARDWRRDRARAGGGVLYDLGIQMLDLGLWLIDYPPAERVSAHLRYVGGGEVEDVAIVVLRFQDGSTFTLDVSWGVAATRESQSLQIIGSHGSCALGPLRVEKEMDRRVVDVTPELRPGVENVFTASYRRELEHFVGMVRGEAEEQLPTEQEALMAVVEACYRSSEEGREIVL